MNRAQRNRVMLSVLMRYRLDGINHTIFIKHLYCPESHYVGGGLGMNAS